MSSRTPVNGVGYDPTLLADAPLVTKADKQEGYNPDLLESQPNPRATPVPPGARNTSKSKYAGTSDESNGVRHAAISPMGQPPAKKPRSRKMLFIIAGVILLLLIGVGVGVGVGVSKSRSNGGSSVLSSAIESATTTGKPSDSPSTSVETTKPISSSSSVSTPVAGGIGDGNVGGGGTNPQSTQSIKEIR